MTQPAQPIADALVARLAAIVEELTGLAPADLDPQVPLAELGLDSLTLTQVASRVQREFGVTIGFREFLTTTRTLAAVARRLEEAGARGAPVAATASPPQAQASAPGGGAVPAVVGPALIPVAPGTSGGMVPMMVAQLEVMAAQLRMLATAEGVTLDGALAEPRTSPVSASAPAAPLMPAGAPEVTPSAAAAPRAATTPRPVSAAHGDALTPHQDAALRQFAEAWGRKTARSKAMVDAQRAVHADPRTAAGWNERWKQLVYPVVVDRSEGAYLWDLDGNRYVDLLSGFGPTFLGHNPPFVVEAIKAQLDRGMELGPQHPLAGEVARLICEMTGLDRAAFACTGSEAVQAALRIARTVTGRTRVVTFAVDYHGNFDEVLVRGIDGAAGPRTVPSAPGVPQRAVDEMTVLEFGSPAALAYIRAHAHELAAVMVEPVRSRVPEVRPREFLQEVRRITRESGTVLFFDEVVTGFRVHPGGAQAFYGIEADLVTYGKVIGGGMPIGVIAGRRPFIDVLDGGPWAFGDDSGPTQGVSFFAGTFVRHPLALAAAHATLRYLRDAGPALQEELNARSARFVAGLNAAADAAGAPIRAEHFGSILYLRCSDAKQPLNAMFWHFLRDEGVFHLEGFPAYLTLAHTDADLAAVTAAFTRAIARMQESRCWPAASAAAPRVAAAEERFAVPPVPHARLGRAPDGSAAWFVEDPDRPGHFIEVGR